MKDRSKMLNNLKMDMALQNNEKLLGRNLKALITGTGSKGGFIGRTDAYKTVIVDDVSLGSYVNVKITEVKGTYLKGYVC